jgi:thimet oligopeptidase
VVLRRAHRHRRPRPRTARGRAHLQLPRKGDENDPGLLQYSDVVTYFHEFGHLMHAILGGQTEWAGLSGFATEGDFIEVPSQMLEEFFRDEKLLQSFAKHYQTGETLPSETIKKMKLAGAFGRADWVRTQLYYTTLSLDLHDQDPAGLDLDAPRSALPEPAALDLARRQSHVRELRPPHRLLVQLLHLRLRQGHRARLLRASSIPATCWLRRRQPLPQAVLEQGGSKPGRQMVRDFLGRDEEFSAFSNWLNEEFEAELAGAVGV